MIVYNYSFYINNILSIAEKDFQVLYKYNKLLKCSSIERFVNKLIANNLPNANDNLKKQLIDYFILLNDLKCQKSKLNDIMCQYFKDNSNFEKLPKW